MATYFYIKDTKNFSLLRLNLRFSKSQFVNFAKLLLMLALCICLSSCSSGRRKNNEHRTTNLRQASYSDIKSWKNDKHLDALVVLARSCNKIITLNPNDHISLLTKLGGKAKDWQEPCRELLNSSFSSSLEARIFFEKWFDPYIASNENYDENGKFTGYYEISMNGSRKKTAKYKYPIYATPPNIERIKGSPAITHKAINQGALSGKGLELAWTDNLARLFFMQIQGSGVLNLDNGSKLKLGYAGQNGHGYKAIGPEFKKYNTGKISSALDMIEWLHKNPTVGKEIMEINPSYVFFKELKHNGGPIGAQGVPLTEHRSIAIDKLLYPYGTPIWIETTLPKTRNYPAAKFERLFIAQDTGGAIKGAVRADLFFGPGRKAEERACYMNQKGRMFILIPKTVKVPKSYTS